MVCLSVVCQHLSVQNHVLAIGSHGVVFSECRACCPAIGPTATGWSSHVCVPLWGQKFWQKVASVQGKPGSKFCTSFRVFLSPFSKWQKLGINNRKMWLNKGKSLSNFQIQIDTLSLRCRRRNCFSLSLHPVDSCISVQLFVWSGMGNLNMLPVVIIS